MDIEDNTYIERIRNIRKLKLDIIKNIKDGDSNSILFLEKLISEEDKLIDRLIEERIHLQDSVMIDTLTGLYNRRILSKIRDIGTVILFDIDYFKTINDTFGHNIGDQAIKAVGETLLNNIRVGDIACRYGGDEFLIVFTTDRFDVIDKRVKKIAEEINNKFHLPGFDITLSVGVSFNEENEDLESLITKADEALYKSKENGRNQVSYYGKEKDDKRLFVKK